MCCRVLRVRLRGAGTCSPVRLDESRVRRTTAAPVGRALASPWSGRHGRRMKPGPAAAPVCVFEVRVGVGRVGRGGRTRASLDIRNFAPRPPPHPSHAAGGDVVAAAHLPSHRRASAAAAAAAGCAPRRGGVARRDGDARQTGEGRRSPCHRDPSRPIASPSDRRSVHVTHKARLLMQRGRLRSPDLGFLRLVEACQESLAWDEAAESPKVDDCSVQSVTRHRWTICSLCCASMSRGPRTASRASPSPNLPPKRTASAATVT